MTKLSSGDEVIFFDECYHRSREFCTKHMSRFGVVTRQVKACDYDAMAAAITPKTRMLISESPTNPHLSVVDLARFDAARQTIQRRNADRCDSRHALQLPAARTWHRLCSAFRDQVPGRPQRPARRRHHRFEGAPNRSASSAASWGPSIRRTTSICWNAASRPSNTDAAAQRERPGGR